MTSLKETINNTLEKLVRYIERGEANGRPVHFINGYSQQLLDAFEREKEVAKLQAQLGMIEYYDQNPTNDSVDWKGLFADNRKALEYDLNKLIHGEDK